MPPRRPSPSGTPSLFGAPVERTPETYLVAHIDGGARGNPGPSGYGVVIEDEQGRPIAQFSRYLGRQTNNFAEYSGLIAALEYAVQHNPNRIKILSDSELLVRQMNGIYKVRNEGLIPLYERARVLIRRLEWFRIEHVRREYNKQADALANLAMDRKE